MSVICSFDVSLTATGYSVIDGGKQLSRGVIKSKPQGKRPIDEIRRMDTIIEHLIEIVEEYKPELVVIEGMAFMAKGTSLVQLGGLNYIIRRELLNIDIPFIIIAPTSLKKFITGKGVAQKDEVILAIYKRYGVTILDNNEADAYALSQIGLALLDRDRKITSKQKEVVDLVSKQLN